MIARALAVAASFALVLTAGACGHAGDARFPSRPEGCDVKIYPGPPEVPTENIGPVSARCAFEVSKEDCLRTLKDQACKLGGDVVWGVDVEPTKQNEKNAWFGRAAHTKAPKTPAP